MQTLSSLSSCHFHIIGLFLSSVTNCQKLHAHVQPSLPSSLVFSASIHCDSLFSRLPSSWRAHCFHFLSGFPTGFCPRSNDRSMDGRTRTDTCTRARKDEAWHINAGALHCQKSMSSQIIMGGIFRGTAASPPRRIVGVDEVETRATIFHEGIKLDITVHRTTTVRTMSGWRCMVLPSAMRK